MCRLYIRMNTFVYCINNDKNLASLVVGKVYRRLPHSDGAEHRMIRVIDEDTSEVDGYLYPESMFFPIELPEAAARLLVIPTR